MIRVALVGAGNRGAEVYGALLLEQPERARLVAVAEPDEPRRARVAAAHGLAGEACYPDWQTLLDGPRLADAVIIATPDRQHVDPAVAALEQGYQVLLEKPVATDHGELLRLRAACERSEAGVTVAHVLRYTRFYRRVRSLLQGGALGELQGVEHNENIGYWHFAHSYVRGHWRREDESCPMLLAKACHDLDLLRWWAGASWRSVSSSGERRFFRAESEPPGAADRCLDGCDAEPDCPWSAPRFYLERHRDSQGWPVTVLGEDSSLEGRRRALAEGPFGRCVFRCDNDVVDHQVASLDFDNGVRAALTVSAFTPRVTRTTTFFGSRGQLRADLEAGSLELVRFLDEAVEPHLVQPEPGGHGGGDRGLMEDFLTRVERAVAGEDPGEAPTALEQSIESHEMAFAAERSRREGRLVTRAEPASVEVRASSEA